MTAVLLDTSAYSALRRGHPEVVSQLGRSARVCLNPIVLGELHAGFRKGVRRGKNEQELEEFLESPRVDVLSVDEDTAERYAVIWHALREAGTPVPTNDLWISATAMQHGLAVLTTDGHFLKVKQIVVRWVRSE